MKFDYSFKGCDIVTAVKKVLDSPNEKLPALILWDDEPASMAQLQRYLKSKKHAVFLRLGVTCNGGFLFDEIYQQLTSKTMRHGNPNIKALKVCAIIKKSKYPYTIVVTNFHLMALDQISWLTGLMIELDLKAKFIYLLHPDHFSKRFYNQVEKKDLRLKYFFKQIKTKYATVE